MNYDGREIGSYRYISDIKKINGKLAFWAQKADGLSCINYDGREIGSYKRTGSIQEINGKLAFVAQKADGLSCINYDGQEIPNLEFESIGIFTYNKETGLLFISGRLGDEIVTYTKYLNDKERQLTLDTEEQKKLQLLNLIKIPDEDKEESITFLHDSDINKRLSQSHKFAINLTKLVKEDPSIFFDDIRSKKEKSPAWRIDQMIDRLFPEVKINKEIEKRKNKKTSFFGDMFGGNNNENKDSEINNSDSFFEDNDYMELNDGDPMMEGKDIGIEFRQDVQGMLATNINISNNGQSRWTRLEFPISTEMQGPTEEITATIKVDKKKEILLPFFTDSKIITSRLKALDEKGNDINFSFDINQLGQVKIRSDKPMSQVLYSQEKPLITPAPDDITAEEYDTYKKQFESRYGKSVIESVLDLPPEIKQFIDSIETLSPIEKLMTIEEYVQQVSYYDFDNKKVQAVKRGKNNDERLAIMQIRMDDITAEKPEIKGKMFAGVCADFALLTTAMLRHAGFTSGVISGLKIDGKTALSSHAHGLSFVNWPSADGKNNIYTLDGTPGSYNEENSELLNTLRSRSLRERLEDKKKNIDVLTKDAENRLKEIQDILDSLDIDKIKGLSNGELEKALNIILRYGVKRNNLHVIESILNTKYAPVNITEIDLDDISNIVTVTRLIESEIKRERLKIKKDVNPDLDSGKKLLETVSEFISRYSNRENDLESINKAILKIEKIFKMSEQYMEPMEAKAAFAVINYLKAKQMVKRVR
jgi:hypothetical protein